MQSRDLNQDLIRLTRERLIDLYKMNLLDDLMTSLPFELVKGLNDAIMARITLASKKAKA